MTKTRSRTANEPTRLDGQTGLTGIRHTSGRPAQPEKRMIFGNRLCQHSCPVYRPGGRQPYSKCEGMIEEGKLHDQVIGGTVKAGLIILIRVAILQRQVRIGMMRYQCVNRYPGRHAKRKQGQEKARQQGPYDTIVSQNSLKQCCKLWHSFQTISPVTQIFYRSPSAPSCSSPSIASRRSFTLPASFNAR